MRHHADVAHISCGTVALCLSIQTLPDPSKLYRSRP